MLYFLYINIDYKRMKGCIEKKDRKIIQKTEKLQESFGKDWWPYHYLLVMVRPLV